MRTAANDVDRLIDIWRATLGIESVGIDDDFFALGGTSLQAVEALLEIERSLGRSMPMSILFEAGSIRALLEHMNAPVTPMSTLVQLQSRGTRPPLYVVPGIGGDPVTMASLARALGPDQPFFSFLSRGLDGHGRPHTKIEDIAEENIRAIDGRSKTQRIMLCGICWGSSVALEMAQRLSQRGNPPELLVVFDPALLETNTTESIGLHPWLARYRFIRNRLNAYWSEVRELDGPARSMWLKNKGETLFNRITAKQEDTSEVRSEIYREAVMAANMRAQYGYAPVAYDNDIHLLLTADREGIADDPRSNWAQRVAPDAEITYVPGTNTGEVLAGSNVRVLADELQRMIDKIV